MALLNKEAYEMKKDSLLYDGRHPFDVSNVQVKLTPTEAGVIRRGQVIDCANGDYSIHAEGGEASAIVAESTSYAMDDTDVSVTVYTSGTFRASEVLAAPDLTDADVEALRGKGIYLK